jgi:hypothetical protein
MSVNNKPNLDKNEREREREKERHRGKEKLFRFSQMVRKAKKRIIEETSRKGVGGPHGCVFLREECRDNARERELIARDVWRIYLFLSFSFYLPAIV